MASNLVDVWTNTVLVNLITEARERPEPATPDDVRICFVERHAVNGGTDYIVAFDHRRSLRQPCDPRAGGSSGKPVGFVGSGRFAEYTETLDLFSSFQVPAGDAALADDEDVSLAMAGIDLALRPGSALVNGVYPENGEFDWDDLAAGAAGSAADIAAYYGLFKALGAMGAGAVLMKIGPVSTLAIGTTAAVARYPVILPAFACLLSTFMVLRTTLSYSRLMRLRTEAAANPEKKPEEEEAARDMGQSAMDTAASLTGTAFAARHYLKTRRLQAIAREKAAEKARAAAEAAEKAAEKARRTRNEEILRRDGQPRPMALAPYRPMDDVYDAVVNGTSDTVVMAGQPGIGKSTLRERIEGALDEQRVPYVSIFALENDSLQQHFTGTLAGIGGIGREEVQALRGNVEGLLERLRGGWVIFDEVSLEASEIVTSPVIAELKRRGIRALYSLTTVKPGASTETVKSMLATRAEAIASVTGQDTTRIFILVPTREEIATVLRTMIGRTRLQFTDEAFDYFAKFIELNANDPQGPFRLAKMTMMGIFTPSAEYFTGGIIPDTIDLVTIKTALSRIKTEINRTELRLPD